MAVDSVVCLQPDLLALCNGCFISHSRQFMTPIWVGDLPPGARNQYYYFCCEKCEEPARQRASYAYTFSWNQWARERLGCA